MTAEVTDEQLQDAFKDFAKKLAESQKPLEPKFEKVLHDNFWDLLA